MIHYKKIKVTLPQVYPKLALDILDYLTKFNVRFELSENEDLLFKPLDLLMTQLNSGCNILDMIRLNYYGYSYSPWFRFDDDSPDKYKNLVEKFGISNSTFYDRVYNDLCIVCRNYTTGKTTKIILKNLDEGGKYYIEFVNSLKYNELLKENLMSDLKLGIFEQHKSLERFLMTL